jgi:hypothetical protein
VTGPRTGTGPAGLVLPAAPDSPARARRHVREALRGRADESVIDTVELCASELVTNARAARRNRAAGEVALEADAVRLAVRDRSPLPPRLVPHSRTAATGRGLALVVAVAADWGLDPDLGGGKAVWCRLPLREQDLREDALYDLWDDDLAELLTEPSLPPSPLPPPAGQNPSPGPAPAGLSRSGPLGAVRLLGYPVREGRRLREHQEEVLRECRLLQLPDADGPEHVTARLVRLSALLAAEYEAELSEPARRLVEAFLSGQASVDLTYPLRPDTRTMVEAWQAARRELDRYGQQEDLLTLATPPDLARLADWVVQEFLRQLDGHPPRPWPPQGA